MNGTAIIRQTYQTSLMVLKTYLNDINDDEMMTRPAKGCNHAAWQLGHLISAEVSLVDSICPGKGGELPDGFADQHSKESSSCDDAAKFCSKAEYLELLDSVGQATMAALDATSDEELDKEGPEHFKEMFPTVGSIWVLIATHTMMHSGQFVALRRKLEKPIVM